MKYLVIGLGIIILVLLVILIFVPSPKPSKSNTIDQMTTKSDKDLAIEKAKIVYEQKKKEGINFDSGPCLSEEIIPDWAADIAHNPREEIDNKPENQCQSFREGKTHHFVELDPLGNLIRAI
jgi:hypothetical protein